MSEPARRAGNKSRTPAPEPPRRVARPEPKRQERPPPPKHGARPSSPARNSKVTAAVRAFSRVLWFSALAVAFLAVLAPWVVDDVPSYIRLGGAVGISTLYTFGLGLRSGGRPLISGGLALVLATGAVVSKQPVLLAGATVATAVVTAVLAVLATKRAARFVDVVREVCIAVAVAAVGAFGVRAYGAEVSLERVGYLALGFSLLGALALVYRLGAGLQGIGRRGLVMIVSGIGLLTVTLAYTEALATWGSPGLIDSIDRTFQSVEAAAGAVPRPTEVLLGVPALAWGVSTRARRRQGWWVCAFGAAGLSVVALSLLDPDVVLLEAGLSLAYSLVLGLLVGYAVIRADLFFTGARGRRARQLEELAAHRPEPGRLEPLL